VGGKSPDMNQNEEKKCEKNISFKKSKIIRAVHQPSAGAKSIAIWI
jgi:hypothetical protein